MKKIFIFLMVILLSANCYADVIIRTSSFDFYKRPNPFNPNLEWTSDIVYKHTDGESFTLWLTDKEYKKLFDNKVFEKYFDGEKVIIVIESNL